MNLRNLNYYSFYLGDKLRPSWWEQRDLYEKTSPNIWVGVEPGAIQYIREGCLH